MNTHAIALGCANGAAMTALQGRNLAGLSESDMVGLIIPHFGRAPVATSGQLKTWAYGTARRSGLGDLGEMGSLWTKITGAVKKVAEVAVAPIKAVASSVEQTAKNATNYAPQVGMAVVGVGLGQPQLVSMAAQGVIAQKQSVEQAQAQAKANADAQAAYDAQVAQQQAVIAAQSAPVMGTSVAQNTFAAPGAAVTGTVTKLPQPADTPQIVGLSMAGIWENIKANPLPWGIAGGLAFLYFRGR